MSTKSLLQVDQKWLSLIEILPNIVCSGNPSAANNKKEEIKAISNFNSFQLSG